MEIWEKGEAFAEKDDDLVFDHSIIILRQGDDFFYSKTDQRILTSSTIDINTLQTTKIPTESLRPPISPQFTQAPDPLPQNTYLKQPSLLDYADSPSAAPDYSSQVLTEVEACEILRKHPHPNIAQYLGCVPENGKIKGLCFVKYPTTLSQRLKDGAPFDKTRCLQGIESGIRHMHELGLIHNDINPLNIMMDGDNPIIIDFDSCKAEGAKLGVKGGTFEWEIDGAEYARRENDFYGLSKLQGLLKESEH